MRRTARILGVAGALVSALTLAACDKPAPQVTIQSGSFSTTVKPSSYCFDVTHCRDYGLDLPEISARPDDTVLIDVPRDLVGRGWSVTALATPSLDKLGSPVTVKDSHSYRVAASANNGNPYIVQIAQLHHGTPDGSRWSFLVQVSDKT
jgi:hypothetical protein